MKVIGYTRVSSDKQDLQKQEHRLLKYAQQQNLHISDFIRAEIFSRRDTKERRIDELLDRLNEGDLLLVAELSRLGRNMLEVIELANQLGKSGVEVIFVRQPELSTTGPHRKLLLVIYSFFADAERKFISIRTKQGLAAAKASGKKLGRPKGSRDKKWVLDPYRGQVWNILNWDYPYAEFVQLAIRSWNGQSATLPIAILSAKILNCSKCGVVRGRLPSRRVPLAPLEGETRGVCESW